MMKEYSMLDTLINLTKDYIAETDDLIAHRRPGEGLFGMPDSAKNSPCHMDYYHKMEAAVHELAGEKPDAETAETLVRFLLTAEDNFPCSKICIWTLTALQQLSLPLIPHLAPEPKKDLAVWYGKKVSRLQRLPIQQQIYKELKK